MPILFDQTSQYLALTASMSLITFLSLPLCPVYNNGSYFTPDSGDRRLSDTVYTIQPVVKTVEQPVVS